MMEQLTMGEARDRYYERNGFGADGGASLKWVPIKILGLKLYIRNTEGRRRAVPIHDLHHVVTGYQTDLRGEAEIGAWEVASGCWRLPTALLLNLGAMGLGALIAPRRVVRAWARGRNTRNLYGELGGVDHLLPRTVDEVRAKLGLDDPHPPVRARDALAVAAVVGALGALVAAPALGALWLLAANL